MAPVIRIDDEVIDKLNKEGIRLGLIFPTPNEVLRKILGLDSKALVDSKDVLNKPLENKHVTEIELNATARKFVLIPLPKEKRRFFPGFKENFVLETDVGVLKAHITGAPGGAPQGDPDAGYQIRAGLGQWYDKHPEAKGGTKVRFEMVEPGKRYKLSIA